MDSQSLTPHSRGGTTDAEPKVGSEETSVL